MAREPLIAWRNRRDPDGLRPHDDATGASVTLIQAVGFALGRWSFFGFMKFRPKSDRDYVEPMPEMIVVADGRAGSRMLKATRDQHHISVYWPGRGESYLVSRPFGRVIVDGAAGPRLTPLEREMLRQRTLTFGDRAIWTEL